MDPQETSGHFFAFIARRANGSREAGQIQAASLRDVHQQLSREGLYLLSAELVTNDSINRIGRRLKQSEAPALISGLANLMRRSVPLDRALSILAASPKVRVASAATKLQDTVRTGVPLSEALQNTIGLSDPVVLALVKMGERSGALSLALDRAAATLKMRAELGRKMREALAYPAILVAVAIASLLMMLILVVPEFRPIIGDKTSQLPILGQVVFWTSEGLVRLWPMMILCFAFLGAWLIVLARNGHLGPRLVGVIESLPIFGSSLSANRAAIRARLLSALLDRSIPLIRALEIIASHRSDQDRCVSGGIERTIEDLKTGSSLAGAFEKHAVFPPSAIELIRLGEETRDLVRMLDAAAEEMESNAEQRLKTLLLYMGPCLIVFVGLIVGVSLYALFTAIVSVNAVSF